MMKNFLLISMAVFLAAACSNNSQTSINQSNQTEENTDGVKTKMTDTLNNLFAIESEAELKEIFGNENVSFDTVYGPEGETSLATILFPGTKDELEILWGDMDKRENMINISQYAFYDEENNMLITDTRWKTSYGIQLGTTLKELIALNEAPISFMGFGWDYSGMIIDLNEGNLEKNPLMLQIGITDFEAMNNNEDYRSLLGDMEFTSDNEAAKRVNPVVLVLSIPKGEY